MKRWLIKLGARAALRAVTRRSPKVEALGGVPVAVIAATLLADWMPPDAAATIGAALGSIITTSVNLAFGDDVPPEE